ncbi:MAG TPA: four helix bundle protein [Bacteroidales bacterium]|nr:four helix bundle protein [Bacteroidales bacterium]
MGNFKKLHVWQNAKDLAVNVYKLTDSVYFNKDFGLKDQIRRSSVSISSNIAEGDNLDTDKQSIKHFYIARGSTAELRTQLIISLEIGYITFEQFERLEPECDKICAMLMPDARRRKF